MSLNKASVGSLVDINENAGVHVDGQITQNFVLTGNVSYAVGEVLGQVTSSGKLVKSIDTATDGSQNPIAVLLHAVDLTGGSDDKADVMVACDKVDLNDLVYGGTWTRDTLTKALRSAGIYAEGSLSTGTNTPV